MMNKKLQIIHFHKIPNKNNFHYQPIMNKKLKKHKKIKNLILKTISNYMKSKVMLFKTFKIMILL